MKHRIYNPDGTTVRVTKKKIKPSGPEEPEEKKVQLPFSVLLAIGAILALPFLLFALALDWAQTEDHNKVEGHGRRRW